MAFEPIFAKPVPECLKRLTSAQAVVEARLLSGSSTIAKVLSVATDVIVNPSEVFAGEARYSGRVNFKALTVDPDGGSHSIDYNADFTDKLSCDILVAGMSPIITAKVLDTDIVSVADNEIKLACVVEVYLDIVSKEPMRCLTSGGEGIYTHDDRIDFCLLASSADATFTVADNMSKVSANNILLSEARIIITKRVAGLDCVTIEGSIINDLCCESEDSSMFSYQLVTQFTQEIATAGARVDNVVCVNAKINSYKCSIELDGEGKSLLSAEYSVGACVRVFSGGTVSPIVDAFSVANELLIAGASVKVCRNKCNETVADRVEGSVTLDVNMPIADNILASTGARLNISKAVAGEGTLTIEGIAACNIIYFSQELNTKNSVAVELPFSITVNALVNSGNLVMASGVVTALSAKLRRGNEIDIKADVSVEYMAVSEDVKYVIEELKIGEERALPSGAFAIHIARGGENLWDVAKALSTTPELVLLQNPALVLPLSGGERIIAYRHLKN